MEVIGGSYGRELLGGVMRRRSYRGGERSYGGGEGELW